MTEQTATAPTPDAAVTAALPPVPQPETCDDGYDWMEQLNGPWWPLVSFAGRLAGDWPYVCVAHYTDRESGHYGLAVWDEGTVTVTGYGSGADRSAATVLHTTDG
jgi:hypothetical protein